MNDGSPHHLPLNSVITLDTELRAERVDVRVRCVNMTASRLMVSVATQAVDVLVVWNWRIGDVVRGIDFCWF